mgnify:FL=1
MVNTKSFTTKSIALFAAIALVVAAVVPLFTKTADAAQVTARSIQMSKSTTSATGTSYQVKFTANTGGTVRSIVVDFCKNSPIIGVSCTAPDSPFTVGGSPSVTVNGGITGSWTAASLNSGRTLYLYKAAGDTLTAGTTVVDFTINNVTNPGGTAGSFYGRILTYADGDDDGNGCSSTDDYAGCYVAGTEGTESNTYTLDNAGTSYTDKGGVALSTAAAITVTALVQETLNFAVTGTSVTMGTGTPQIINDTQTWISSAVNIDLDTNATTGLNIRLFGTHLVSGSNSLTGSSTLGVLTGSTNSQFGICTKDSTNGQVVADAVYETLAANCTTAGTSTFAWDNTATSATGGDTVFTSTGPVDDDINSNVDIYYAARADNNVPAGQYQATHQLIATGTF